MRESEFEQHETEEAAAEAAHIGGSPSEDAEYTTDESRRAVEEGGGGEAEGFEQAERELIDNASHGDQHAARRAIQDAPEEIDDARAGEYGQADAERSSERTPDSTD